MCQHTWKGNQKFKSQKGQNRKTNSIRKQGNRLTWRPCKGDEFEILIFEAKRQNAGICGTCSKCFDWQACDSSSKIRVSPAP